MKRNPKVITRGALRLIASSEFISANEKKSKREQKGKEGESTESTERRAVNLQSVQDRVEKRSDREMSPRISELCAEPSAAPRRALRCVEARPPGV